MISDLLKLAECNQRRARAILESTDLFTIWQRHGIRPELVGSLRTGLLLRNLDIDMHMYSEPFSMSDSFAAMAELARNPRIRRIEYANLLDAEDNCLEWHAWYEDEMGETWRFDMMHIRMESRYAGYFERVADRILERLTPETRHAVLEIKDGLERTPAPSGKVMSVEIYQAVLEDSVRDTASFLAWKSARPEAGIVEWMP
ncbi:MAG: hypothetical protein AB7E32_08640 [Desulfovibrio sp.]